MYITYSSCYYVRGFGVRVWEVRMQGWRCEGSDVRVWEVRMQGWRCEGLV